MLDYLSHGEVTDAEDVVRIAVGYTERDVNMPTSYQQWVWEREANINWSVVICQGSTRSELPWGLPRHFARVTRG